MSIDDLVSQMHELGGSFCVPIALILHTPNGVMLVSNVSSQDTVFYTHKAHAIARGKNNGTVSNELSLELVENIEETWFTNPT